MVSERSRQLDVHALLGPAAYPHQVGKLELLETHISWVVLTGPFAYKIKKGLNLGFLDFSTLAKRRFFCEEEIRLNGRLAPEIYLAAVPIRGTHDCPRLSGSGPVIEYAVKMRQFPQRDLLDRLVDRNQLRNEHVDAMASLVARFHERIPPAQPQTTFGRPAQVHAPVDDNVRQTRSRVDDARVRKRLDALRHWSDAAFKRLSDHMQKRRSEGFIRECHGDMHLGNMALLHGRILIFDGIEFNDNLRWIDVMSEVAFLTSDLEYRARPDYAWRFLNGYLESTGDYAGLALLRYYQAYRAMVRAKVSCIRLHQPELTDTDRAEGEKEFQRHLTQAEGYTRPARPFLVLMRGLSGSGKTVVSQRLLERAGAVRLRSDVERKRLFGLTPGDRAEAGVGRGIYTPEASERTYHRLLTLACAVLRAGHPVIVDATFLRREQRDPFAALAGDLAVPCLVLELHAEPAVLRERVQKRLAAGTGASEAGVEVLEHQLRSRQPLDADEEHLAIRIPSDREIDFESLLRQLKDRRGAGAMNPGA